MPSLSVQVEGAKELRKKMALEGANLYGPPMRKVMEKGQRIMYAVVSTRAPAAIAAVAKLQTLNPKPFGIGRVKFAAGYGGKSRFNYPRAAAILNNGGRGGRARWRSGPMAGRPTKGWFHGIVRMAAVKRAIDGLVVEAAKEIEERWTQT